MTRNFFYELSLSIYPEDYAFGEGIPTSSIKFTFWTESDENGLKLNSWHMHYIPLNKNQALNYCHHPCIYFYSWDILLCWDIPPPLLRHDWKLCHVTYNKEKRSDCDIFCFFSKITIFVASFYHIKINGWPSMISVQGQSCVSEGVRSTK